MIENILVVFKIIIFIICAPFRFVSAVCRGSVAVGEWLFITSIKTIIGLCGIAFIVFFCYGMLRVILHPLFK
jgi:hypothetical protein